MISAKLIGGLGNQLFQISTAYAVASDNHDVCAFEFSDVIPGQGYDPNHYRNNIFKNLRSLPNGWRVRSHYKENGLDYSPIPYSSDMLLMGYFASDKYFNHVRDNILSLFLNKPILDGMRKGFCSILKNSVSIHVRRGDYLKYPRVYEQLGVDYYKRALSLIKENHQVDNIIVFSDDIPWCKEHIKISNVYFSECMRDYGDMYLMSLCNHNIMANSSFSWWGAYFNTNTDSMAIMPHKWFKQDGPQSAEHLFRDEWITI